MWSFILLPLPSFPQTLHRQFLCLLPCIVTKWFWSGRQADVVPLWQWDPTLYVYDLLHFWYHQIFPNRSLYYDNLPPPKVGEVLLFYFSQTASRWFLSLSLMKSASTSPTIGGGRVGEGCSFSVVPKFRRRPNPTIPLHSKFINDQLCFWHHTFSTNSSSTISSSILSTTRRDELYLSWVFFVSRVPCQKATRWPHTRWC